MHLKSLVDFPALMEFLRLELDWTDLVERLEVPVEFLADSQHQARLEFDLQEDCLRELNSSANHSDFHLNWARLCCPNSSAKVSLELPDFAGQLNLSWRHFRVLHSRVNCMEAEDLHFHCPNFGVPD